MTLEKNPWPQPESSLPLLTWTGSFACLPSPLETLKTQRTIALNTVERASSELALAEKLYLEAQELRLQSKRLYETLDRKLAELDGRLRVVSTKKPKKAAKAETGKKPEKKTLLKNLTENEKKALLAELLG